jgi:hypothetical protein
VGEPSHEPRREFVQGSGWRGGEPIFAVAPEPFDGIEFGRRGREKEQADIGGQVERAGFVKRAVGEQQHVKLSGRGSGEMSEEELKALSIEEGECEKEACPRPQFPRTLQIETLEAIGSGYHGRDAPRGNPLPHDRQEPAPAFILRPHATVRVTPLGGSVACG